MSTPGNSSLRTGGALNAAIAVLHVVIIFVGAPGYLYFGAPDLARMADRGSAMPALITALLVLIFLGFAAYAWSGAGLIRRLPLLKAGLVTIGVIYVMRGLIVILDVVRLIRGFDYPPRQAVFSLVALVIGVLYLAGARRVTAPAA